MTATFKKTEYLVQVTVVEARNLRGKDASGTSDPYVKITVANLAPQVTTTAQATTSMAWNQSFTFTNLLLSDTELETMEILLECFDLNDFALNPLIGSHSVGLATLYRNMNHEFYNAWLPLMNPEVSSEPQGYLLTSCYIIGPQDSPPVHAINEIVYFDEEPDDLEGIPEEELTPEQIKARKDKNKRVAEISKPALLQRGYQLRINIAKAEDIAQIGYAAPDSFISVRCCGFLLTTPIANGTQKPVFNAKLQFPVYLPLMNDKIVIRVWDQRKGLPDYFIASVPEVPSETDYFNINSLLAKGGNMPYRWINLYGIPGDERSSEVTKLILGKQKLFEGTAYMGRVLMSINLAPNEKPVKGRFPLNSYREPPELDYTLFADVYELQEAVGCGETVWIKITIGSESQESGKAYQAKGDDAAAKATYTWKSKQIILDEISHPFPTDQSQIPDIFVSVYTESFWGTKRIGYIRLPVNDPSLTNNDPKWYPVKSVENNINNAKVGFLLLNLHFTNSKKKGSRVAKRRNINHVFYFISYIHAGYDLAPDLPPDSVHPSAEIVVGKKTLHPKKNEHHGKNPIWEDFVADEADLTQNLEFASNITFRVKNVATGILEKGQELITGGIIGEFSLPAMDCMQIKKIEDFKLEPKIYILYKDGQPQGRILASFTLVKNVKKATEMKVEDFIGQKKKYDIEFAVVGIRNLNPAFRKPTIHLRIPGYKSAIEPLKCLEDEDSDDFKNPNFLNIMRVKDVELYDDPLYLPSVEVEVKNNKLLGSSLHLTMPLWEYAEWALSGRLVEVSNIFNASMTGTVVKKDDKEKIDSSRKDKEKEKTKLEKEREKMKAAGGFVLNIPGGDLKNVADETKRLLDKEDKLEKQKPKETDIVFKGGHKFGEGAKKKEGEWDLENLQEELNNARAAEAEKGGESDDEFMARTTAATDSNFRIDMEEVFDCTKKDKDKERAEKKALIEEKLQKIKELKQEAVQRPEEINKYVQEINRLKEDFVDVVKFSGHSDKLGEDYDYGRPITKDPAEKDLALPYLSYELHKFLPIITSSREENGIIKSGLLSDAVLKGLLKIVPQDEKDQEAMEKKSMKSKASRATSRASSKNRGLKFRSNDLDIHYPFDVFNPIYMKYFRNPKPLKIRLYILRALNLTAQEDVVEMPNRLAGFYAMSSASTFPVIKVGEANKQDFDLTKEIYDDKALIPNTLNPSFFKNYELDAQFPEDWRLNVQIMNKATILTNLIGETNIDLEDRYFGNKQNKQKLAYELRKKFLEDEFRKQENEAQTGGQTANILELEKKMDQNRREIAKLTGLLEGLAKPVALVEYRALKNSGKNTSQGSLEMFLEVLTTDVARSQPVAKIEPPKPTQYEIRLIIFETFDIPRDGETVDIFVKASYSPDGWSGQEVVKSTDTHLGSSDGYGIFNWRMKFPLTIPCAFPRLRFSVYDMNVFASDESLGEAAISLRRVIKKLLTEGKFEQAPRKILLSHPNKPGKSMGEILYSLQVIPKLEAEASPVGEAQEEPNENPYLEKPKIGRGIGDFLKGVGFNFNIWGFLTGRIFKIILGLIASAIVTMILFVKPGILVKSS